MRRSTGHSRPAAARALRLPPMRRQPTATASACTAPHPEESGLRALWRSPRGGADRRAGVPRPGQCWSQCARAPPAIEVLPTPRGRQRRAAARAASTETLFPQSLSETKLRVASSGCTRVWRASWGQGGSGQRSQARVIRRPDHPTIGNQGGNVAMWRYVKDGISCPDPHRRGPDACPPGHLLGIALLDRDRLAIAKRQVQSRYGRRNIEREPVRLREDGQGIGPDLVCHVAIARDPVCPDDDEIDLAPLHQVPDHVIGNKRDRDAFLLQLPGSQPGALQERSRLAGPHRQSSAGRVRRADNPQGGPIAGGGQSAGVTVGENGGPIGDQPLAVRPDRPIVTNVFLPDPLRLSDEGLDELGDREGLMLLSAPQHPLDSPRQIYGCGAGLAQCLAMTRQFLEKLLKGVYLDCLRR